jgi:hypothetical protein
MKHLKRLVVKAKLIRQILATPANDKYLSTSSGFLF